MSASVAVRQNAQPFVGVAATKAATQGPVSSGRGDLLLSNEFQPEPDRLLAPLSIAL